MINTDFRIMVTSKGRHRGFNCISKILFAKLRGHVGFLYISLYSFLHNLKIVLLFWEPGMVPPHKGNNQTWSYSLVLPGLLVKADARTRTHTWGTYFGKWPYRTRVRTVEQGRRESQSFPPGCVIKLATCGKLGLNLLGASELVSLSEEEGVFHWL